MVERSQVRRAADRALQEEAQTVAADGYGAGGFGEKRGLRLER